MSAAVEHGFTNVVLSDDDYKTVFSGVKIGVNFTASPLSEFLKLTDLAKQRFLLRPACNNLFACLQHVYAHKEASTSDVAVLPKQPGMYLA